MRGINKKISIFEVNILIFFMTLQLHHLKDKNMSVYMTSLELFDKRVTCFI